ncbi:MAG: sensor histidine kinase [Nitrososphaeraceae archaeon]|jgi:signal transduction histidine kinase
MVNHNKTIPTERSRKLSTEDLLTIKSVELIAKTEELKKTNNSLLASHNALKLKVKELNKSNNALLESDNNLALVIKELEEANEKFAKVNKELAAVNKELALSNEEIKQNGNMQIEFINIASHELRTPIQPILGLTEIIQSKIKDTEQIELLDAIIRNAKRLKQLTDDIFNVTKIESHSLNLNKEQFDLNEQIEAVINDIKNQINIRYNNNAIKLIFEVEVKEGKGVSIKADKVRIQEVISNLLNNAIKFTNEGTIYITTEKKKTDKGGEVIVKVKDTGIGMPSNILPNLFSKFATGSPFKRGIGLGLFISKSIVEAHGGKIWAQNNTDGRGSTFYFSLPLGK